MATTVDYVEFVCDQLKGNYSVRSKKMFGEYMIYINGKPILLLCDNTVFVKILPPIALLMAEAERGYPYQGAKEHYVLDVEDRELTEKVIGILEAITPLPKKK